MAGRKSTPKNVLLAMPFDINVDMSILRRTSPHAERMITKYFKDGGSYDLCIPLTESSSLHSNECVDNKNDTYTISSAFIQIEHRERSVPRKEPHDSHMLELANRCLTEQQCAGVMLYGDVYARLFILRDDGFTINAADVEIGHVFMCFFGGLLDDPTSNDVYRDRHIELHGGLPSDKVCSACWAVGDFKECEKCNIGIYTCSTGCYMSCHSFACKKIMQLPLECRKINPIASFRVTQSVRLMEDPEVFKAFSKPALSRICTVCGIRGTLKCGTCLKTYYCSKACQTLAYPVHRRLHH